MDRAVELAQAKAGKVATNRDGDRVLVPLPDGTYDITGSTFGPTAAANYEDDIGEYYRVTRIVRR